MRVRRLWIALQFVNHVGWRQCWSVAATVLELREFNRTHGSYRDGAWLIVRLP